MTTSIARRLATVAVTAFALALIGTAPAGAAVPTLVVGDSLGVGMLPSLGALVPGRELTWRVRSGRTTPQGLAVLREALRDLAPAAVVVSLGTNDGPSPARFADRIRRVLAAIPPAACVVWPSIVRPPRKGDETGLNRVLLRIAEEDPRLVVPDWSAAVRSGRVSLPDGLHPDARGFARRSRMVAAALREGCSAPTTGGVPAP